MRKKIVWSGNSASIVIDKTLLRLLGLKVGSYVDIETDGRTIVLQKSDLQGTDEDSGSRPAEVEAHGGVTNCELKRLTMRAPGVFRGLVERYSIPFDIFRDVCHLNVTPPNGKGPGGGWVDSLMPYWSWVDSERRFKASPAEIATMQRFEVLYSERAQGSRWPEALAHALEAVPMVRDPEGSEDCAGNESVESDVDRSRTKSFMAAIWATLDAEEAEQEAERAG
jgi:hypothetical protein